MPLTRLVIGLLTAAAGARPARADPFVSGVLTNKVLDFDGTTGAFKRAFVTARSGGLNNPNDSPSAPTSTLTSSGRRRR